MDDDALARVHALLNKWWEEEEVPKEVLRAKVALLNQKGDEADLNNYRPISLINSVFKDLRICHKM
eukprot:3273506-Alexandrium_andersonii.AAC.1